MTSHKHYPYAVIDLTERCNLRCEHCFFFKEERGGLKDLPDDEFLSRLAQLQKQHNIQGMSWVGGEPLLRLNVLLEGVKLFEHNVIFSNGTVPIPDDFPLALGVSIDGPREINDAIRGPGVFDKVMANIDGKPNIYFQYVLSKKNFSALEESLELLTKTTANGMIISIYVPVKNDDTGMAFDFQERDLVIDKIMELKTRYPNFIFNTGESLNLMRSKTAKKITDNCDMVENCLAMDTHFNQKTPCCYGSDVDCDNCAAPTPFNRAAAAQHKIKSQHFLT